MKSSAARALRILWLSACLAVPAVQAQQSVTATSAPASNGASPRNDGAPDSPRRHSDSRLLVVPVDIELFSISAGGVAEPKADWTELARRHFRDALIARSDLLGTQVQELSESDLDAFAQINALHGAVAQSVGTPLPTKKHALDWSLGDAVSPLRAQTGADHALFLWVRDSYASTERKVAMVALAMIGVGLGGGLQQGYASLVDLRDGRLVWFKRLLRQTGDLREAESAAETVEALLKGFPAVK